MALLDIDASNRLMARPARQITPYEEAIISEVLQVFAQCQLQRNTFAQQWEDVAELILPTSRNTFYYGTFNWQGEKKTDRQIDSTGMLALARFKAIIDSLLTPRNMFWHGLEADDPYVMKDRRVKEWFEIATKLLFKYRYTPHANFSGQNVGVYESLGAFGTGGMFVDSFDATNYRGMRGLRYKMIPLGELFLLENHQGLVDGFVRWFRLTARQILQKWGEAAFPAELVSPLQQNSQMPFDILHYVCPRTDYDPERIDEKGKPWASYYVSMTGRCLLDEGGYTTFPCAITRYDQTPGETYGRGPAMSVLPGLKTLNSQKKTFLKQGHRAADPVLLTADDGIVDMSLRPGAMNKGGVTAEGRPLVHVLPTGNIAINEKMMEMEQTIINDAFLVTLFQILTESPQMTATEVIERTNEKGILLAPTVGRQQSEYIGPLIDRELDVLAAQRLLPPMPGLLLEAGGRYQVVHTSPLSRAMKAQEVSGFNRTVQMVTEIANVTQDPSLFDPFDFDVAIPEISSTMAVPISWMATDGQIMAKRQARAAQAAAQAKIQAAPAAAALMKAEAQAPEQAQGEE